MSNFRINSRAPQPYITVRATSSIHNNRRKWTPIIRKHLKRTVKVLQHESWANMETGTVLNKTIHEFNKIIRSIPAENIIDIYFSFTKEPSLYYYFDFDSGFTLSVEYFMDNSSNQETIIQLIKDDEDLIFVSDDIVNVSKEIRQLIQGNDNDFDHVPHLEMPIQHAHCFS